MEKCNCQKPEKTIKDFDFEKFLKIFTTILFTVGLVIYSFCLGFFHRFQIPDYPSLIDAVRFYLTSILRNVFTQPSLLFYLMVMLLAALRVGSVLSENLKTWRFGLEFSAWIIGSVTFLYFYRQAWIVAPLIISVISGLKVISTTLDNKKNALTKSRAAVTHLLVIIFSSYMSFISLDLNHFSNKPRNVFFPTGLGIERYEPSNLIWIDGDKRYWASCEDTRGVIYGTQGKEEVFVQTEMAMDLYQFFCTSI